MQDENWEAGLDWEEFDPIGGMPFYLFVRDCCMATLERSIGELAKRRAAETAKVEHWERISRCAMRLEEAFADFGEAVGISNMVAYIDAKIAEDSPRPSMTVGRWFDYGRHLTRAMRNGSPVPRAIRDTLAEAERDLASAQTLYAFLKHYLAIARGDFKLRNAPDKYKTRAFRDFASAVKETIEIGNRLNCETGSCFIRDLAKCINDIKSMSAHAHKVCRRVKRELDRQGASFWSDLANWRSMMAL